MELFCGPVFFRIPTVYRKKGDMTICHRHHFDHPGIILCGAGTYHLVDPIEVNANDHCIKWTERESCSIRQARPEDILAGNYGVFLCLVPRGTYHYFVADEDDTVETCIYAHQVPQSIALLNPGTLDAPPTSRRDADGSLWYRVNEKICQEANLWGDGAAYR